MANAEGQTKLTLILPLFFIFFLAACSARVSTEDIRAKLNSGSNEELLEKMQQSHETHQEFVTALNLARVYQMQGRWQDSIKLYNEALYILEEYEGRAIVNLREVFGEVGSILISKGSKGYFGTGYERTLLHTFNSLNYLMLGDFSGAMVEMRKMEQRQEIWLAEEEFRLKEHIEELRETKTEKYADLDALPANYTMTALLNDPRTKALASSYQDAFSYSLSAVISRLAHDQDYAKVSQRRATTLDTNAYNLFNSATETLADKNKQEVCVIVFCGLAPALGMERIRIPAPYVGYIMLDLPTFIPPIKLNAPHAENAKGQPLSLYALLRTDLLAYRTLRDELRYEIGSAIARMVARAAVAGTVYVAASKNKKTHDFAQILSTLVTGITDLFSSISSQNVRNWELLPATGYIGQGYVPRGEPVRIKIEQVEREISLPAEAKGVIIMVTHTTKSKMRIDYVAY